MKQARLPTPELRDPIVRLQGRVLMLVDDADMMRRQLAGEDIPFHENLPLRNDVSTDEITPSRVCFHLDERLGEFPYVGLTSGGIQCVQPGAVRAGGFVASVSGRRRGKGSSREQSPYAELCAGIRIVVAESFEPIYKRNCHNLGLLTSTNFGLVERIRRGEPIPLEVFLEDEDEITQQIIRHGGLFEYNTARLRGHRLPFTKQKRPMTLAEKIIARHVVHDLAKDRVGIAAVAPGQSHFVRCDLRFSHEYVTPMARAFLESRLGGDVRIRRPETTLLFEDHLALLGNVTDGVSDEALRLAGTLTAKQRSFARAQGVKLYGLKHGESVAICHVKVAESYALPGEVVAGSDSHTPHSGAVGCLAFGIGASDLFNAWLTEDVRLTVPETLRVDLTGTLRPNVTAKDVMLTLLGLPGIRNGGALGRVIEYGGPGVASLSMDERMTMTNMCAEAGAFTGIFPPDELTAAELVRRRGIPECDAEEICASVAPDPRAVYSDTLALDLSKIVPMVAVPGDPGNGVPITELGIVPVDTAYGGSCTAAKREDLDMYALVLREALATGHTVHPDVTFYIQWGSQEVKEYCHARGYPELFAAAGAIVLEAGCGACINAGPGSSRGASEVTISAQNRNFPGRSGPGNVYLGSPLTVAASAVEGRIVAYDA